MPLKDSGSFRAAVGTIPVRDILLSLRAMPRGHRGPRLTSAQRCHFRFGFRSVEVRELFRASPNRPRHQDVTIHVNGTPYLLAPGNARTFTIPAGAYTFQILPWQTEPQSRTIAAHEDRPLRVYLRGQRQILIHNSGIADHFAGFLPEPLQKAFQHCHRLRQVSLPMATNAVAIRPSATTPRMGWTGLVDTST